MPYISKSELAELKEVRRHLEMNSCSFSAPEKWPCVGNWPERNKDFTNSVREQTELWRKSWILPVLDRILGQDEK
jgi:hypothetical protein